MDRGLMVKAKAKAKSRSKDSNKFEDQAKKYFNCTDSERAAFEAGIKLASVYHQFVGTPVSKANVNLLEKAITEGVRIQPFVDDVHVQIVGLGNKRVESRTKDDKIKKKQHEYDYLSLTGNMINIRLKIKYNKSEAQANLRYIEEMDYPLMFLTSIN